MMKTATFALVLLAAGAAQAASPEEPVHRVMELAEARLAVDGPAGDYFEEERLARDFSTSFVAAYKAASKFPAYDDGSSNPFSYDVIANGQDGCPLEDVSIKPPAASGGAAVVRVTFKLWRCVPADDPSYDSISEVRFDVIEENGRPVIADIHRIRDGKWVSLVAEMGEIVKTGEAQ